MERMTQNERVLRHLSDFGSITSHVAMRDYGIMRLASRVADLKRQGYAIVSERETAENRYGEKVSYARYRLEA